jgi:hypothetical protein
MSERTDAARRLVREHLTWSKVLGVAGTGAGLVVALMAILGAPTCGGLAAKADVAEARAEAERATGEVGDRLEKHLDHEEHDHEKMWDELKTQRQMINDNQIEILERLPPRRGH